MKIAYLMLVHNNPQLQKRAMAMLSSDDCSCFVHVDLKADIRQFCPTPGNVIFVEPRIPVYWGEFSQVEATLHLLRRALSCPEHYDYLVLLQGADYPLRSSRYIQRFFAEHRGSEFINLAKMPAPGFPLSKINKLRYPAKKAAMRFVARVLGVQRDYRKHLGYLQPYSGDASWALSREACQYLLEFAAENPQLERYFRNTQSSDEMFFHTILGNSSFSSRVRKSVLYRDYPATSSHPALLSEKHIEFFESQEKMCTEDEWGVGEVLFARKFSDDTLRLIDRIDEMIRRSESKDACATAYTDRGAIAEEALSQTSS